MTDTVNCVMLLRCHHCKSIHEGKSMPYDKMTRGKKHKMSGKKPGKAGDSTKAKRSMRGTKR